MKISCCWLFAIDRYGYPPSIADTYKALEDIARMGFEYVEIEAFYIKENNVVELYNQRDKLKNKLNDLGLKFINYPIMLPGLLSPNEKIRRENLELFDIGVQTALYLGSESVQLDSFPPSLEFIGETPYHDAIKYGRVFRVKIDPAYSWDREWDTLVNMFKTCCERIKTTDLKILLEPRVGEKIPNADAILRLFEQVNSPILGAILDVAHMQAQKEIIPLSVEKLGKKIFAVHVADNDSTTNAHYKVGNGTVDWEGTLLALKKFDFKGYFAIDIMPIDNKDLEKDFIQSKDDIEKLGKKLGM